jgi:predicted enzyme related to lactoylglutathione lyase
VEPRVSLLTLGVNDLGRAIAFYRDGLGWPKSDIWLLAHRGTEADLRGVVSSYSPGGGAGCLPPGFPRMHSYTRHFGE